MTTNTAVPDLEAALARLAEVSGATDLSASTLLIDADIDSIDFVEWLGAMEITVELDDGKLYDLLEDGTIEDLYNAIVESVV